ncbi:MAG: hypothetical protein MI923_20290 [Phycisphaerales bacterium]|nr:hypothetical protein [Phycisphaerales bacterium]
MGRPTDEGRSIRRPRSRIRSRAALPLQKNRGARLSVAHPHRFSLQAGLGSPIQTRRLTPYTNERRGPGKKRTNQVRASTIALADPCFRISVPAGCAPLGALAPLRPPMTCIQSSVRVT